MLLPWPSKLHFKTNFSEHVCYVCGVHMSDVTNHHTKFSRVHGNAAPEVWERGDYRIRASFSLIQHKKNLTPYRFVADSSQMTSNRPTYMVVFLACFDVDLFGENVTSGPHDVSSFFFMLDECEIRSHIKFPSLSRFGIRLNLQLPPISTNF